MEYTSQVTAGPFWGGSNNWRSSEWRNVPLVDDDEISNTSSEGSDKSEPRTDRKEPINLDVRRMAENRPIASPPSASCLKRIGPGFVGPILGHGCVKGLSAWTAALTFALHDEIFGGPRYTSLAIGAIGVVVWFGSTIISVNNRAKDRSISSVIAESLGYAAVGPILGPIDIIEKFTSTRQREALVQASSYRSIPEA